MTTKEKYSYEVKVQIKKGVNFELNVFETPISQRIYLAEVAKKYNYKQSNKNHSKGVAFFLTLQKVYIQMKQCGEI